LEEHLLAQHFCDALRANRRADWCVPLPSAALVSRRLCPLALGERRHYDVIPLEIESRKSRRAADRF
jgi:hypothetical protein